MKRRNFLKASAIACSAMSLGNLPVYGATSQTKDMGNTEYWDMIKYNYDVSDKYINLEAGYYGIMSKPVMAAFMKNNHYVNQNSSFYARQLFAEDYDKLINRLAQKLGVDADELALTRNATESLQSLIGGYNKLEPGDSVLYADLDYDSMQAEMEHLRTYRKANVIKINMPEPASYENIISAYEEALNNNPECKLLLLTHMSNRTGLIIPTQEIIAMAKARGVDVILDAAHSWGQFDFDFNALNADFVGFNLHKWFGAPLGVGLLYIRKSRQEDIDPSRSEDPNSAAIRSKVHTGTMNFASVMTVNDALDFHESIGIKNIGSRLRFLRDNWVNGVANNSKVEVLTPNDPRMYAGITSFRLKGVTSLEDNRKLMDTLLSDYGIFAAAKTGIKNGSYIRVTPALYNSPADTQKLADAINNITG